jgi:uncharacterized protein
MRIKVQDIGEAVKEVSFEEPTAKLNSLVERGPVHDYRFVGPAKVNISHYRAGQDIFLSGEAASEIVGQCARCLESFRVVLNAAFSYVLVPRIEPKVELEAEDLDLSFYDGDDIEVSPLVREQVLLSLPTQPLCREDCRGLCSSCGVNLNIETCNCGDAEGDPRLAVLRSLKVGP